MDPQTHVAPGRVLSSSKSLTIGICSNLVNIQRIVLWGVKSPSKTLTYCMISFIERS